MKIIITGASDGIGKSMALAFARRGHTLGLIARREELLGAVAKACREAGSPLVEFATADVTDSPKLRAAIDSLDKRLNGLDGFVANAGIDMPTDPFGDGYEQIRKIFEVNLLAAIDGIEYVKARLIRQKGWIAGVTSVAAARGMQGAAAYCASKAGFHAYLEALQIDLKAKGVTVTIVAPGFIDTPMTQKNKFPMPFLMNVDEAGEIFSNGVLNGKALVITPMPFIPTFWILRSIPHFIYSRVASLFLFKR